MKQIFSQRRPLEPAIHIVSWLLIFGFPLVFADRGNSMDWHQFLRHSCVPLCYFLIFYINYLWLVPRYLFNDEMRKYIIANAILIFFSSLMLHLLLEAFNTPPPEEFTRGCLHAGYSTYATSCWWYSLPDWELPSAPACDGDKRKKCFWKPNGKRRKRNWRISRTNWTPISCSTHWIISMHW